MLGIYVLNKIILYLHFICPIFLTADKDLSHGDHSLCVLCREYSLNRAEFPSDL